MAPLIRFKRVEIDSNICFHGKKRRTLKYTVRSLSLIPEARTAGKQTDPEPIPEIFWQ